MTKYDVPRDDEGRRLCEHCLIKPVPESLGTKPRRYCSRNCRQRAYEARKTGAAIRTAVAVEAARRATSRDDANGKSRDVPEPPPPPRRGRRGASRTAAAMPLLPLEE